MSKDKRALRIVYMGTPAFAVAGLKRLLQENYTIVGVITAPDRPAGRGQKLRESELKVFAKENGLKILQPTNLKSESFIEELKSLEANLQIVVAFRMLPKVVWQMPEFGTFNLHASLLPQYRGAAPINWAIINGETETGVTTFFIDEKIDTGEIILQENTGIGDNESAGELHDRLMDIGACTILNTVKLIENNEVQLTKQIDDNQLKAAPKINRDTCEIDWTLTLEKIYDHIRGLSPYPAAWTTLVNGNKTYSLKIYNTIKHSKEHRYPNGTVKSDNGNFNIYTNNGFLEILELQISGKKRMKAKELLNGFKLKTDAYVR